MDKINSLHFSLNNVFHSETCHIMAVKCFMLDNYVHIIWIFVLNLCFRLCDYTASSSGRNLWQCRGFWITWMYPKVKQHKTAVMFIWTIARWSYTPKCWLLESSFADKFNMSSLSFISGLRWSVPLLLRFALVQHILEPTWLSDFTILKNLVINLLWYVFFFNSTKTSY